MPQRIVESAIALTLGALLACGPATPAAHAQDAPSVAPRAPAPPPLPPPVPVAHHGRTLVTQAPPDPPPEPPAEPLDGPPPEGTRIPGEGSVPEPRAIRGQGGGATTTGGLEHGEVRDVVRDSQSRFRHCFDRLRQDFPDTTEAHITIRFSIASAGSVADCEVVSSVPRDDAFATCVQTLVKALDFPAAASATEVTYPFTFQITAGE
jgi:hypothetical protein